MLPVAHSHASLVRSRAKPLYVMRKRARGLDRPAEASCDYKKREHKTEYKTLSRSVFCKIRIQDFADRLQGSGFYRKEILTAVCTLFSVLVFCNMKRPLYYKKQEGPCITDCNMVVSCTFTDRVREYGIRINIVLILYIIPMMLAR